MSAKHNEGEACAGGQVAWSGEGGKRSQTEAPGHQGRTWAVSFMALAHLVERTKEGEIVLVRLGGHLDAKEEDDDERVGEQQVHEWYCTRAPRGPASARNSIKTCVQDVSTKDLSVSEARVHCRLAWKQVDMQHAAAGQRRGGRAAHPLVMRIM